jgi:hypothetical protein
MRHKSASYIGVTIIDSEALQVSSIYLVSGVFTGWFTWKAGKWAGLDWTHNGIRNTDNADMGIWEGTAVCMGDARCLASSFSCTL